MSFKWRIKSFGNSIGMHYRTANLPAGRQDILSVEFWVLLRPNCEAIIHTIKKQKLMDNVPCPACPTTGGSADEDGKAVGGEKQGAFDTFGPFPSRAPLLPVPNFRERWGKKKLIQIGNPRGMRVDGFARRQNHFRNPEKVKKRAWTGYNPHPSHFIFIHNHT